MRLGYGGQADQETGALVRRIRYAYGAFVELNQFLCNTEPQPVILLVASGTVSPVETVKYMLFVSSSMPQPWSDTVRQTMLRLRESRFLSV